MITGSAPRQGAGLRVEGARHSDGDEQQKICGIGAVKEEGTLRSWRGELFYQYASPVSPHSDCRPL